MSTCIFVQSTFFFKVYVQIFNHFCVHSLNQAVKNQVITVFMVCMSQPGTVDMLKHKININIDHFLAISVISISKDMDTRTNLILNYVWRLIIIRNQQAVVD